MRAKDAPPVSSLSSRACSTATFAEGTMRFRACARPWALSARAEPFPWGEAMALASAC